MTKKIFLLSVLWSLLPAQDLEGKKVFETYCWGCHHQSAVAFGPSFAQIAQKRTFEAIEAYILDPKAMYKVFGHKRSVMPKLDLTDSERARIAHYILSFKKDH